MTKVGIEVPRSGQAYSLEEAIRIAKEIGFHSRYKTQLHSGRDRRSYCLQY